MTGWNITKKLSEEECLAIGGHCYEVSPIVFDTNPPQFERVCKHCGHKQTGMQQPNIAWRE